MSDEEIEETLGQLQIPAKLLEASNVGFRDRTKRRLSLPLGSIREANRRSSIASASSGGKHKSRKCTKVDEKTLRREPLLKIKKSLVCLAAFITDMVPLGY